MAQTILILAANPKDTSRLRLDEEVRDIGEGLQRAKHRDQFVLEQKWAVRPRDIQRAMLDINPSIVHFSGHGTEGEGLVFEDETGSAKLVDGEALAGLFELFEEQLKCVVLNGCYSEVQAEAIAQHINYVIGMKKAIGDKAAIEFAVGFYDALGSGKPVEFAYKFGCAAIRLAGIPEQLTPVLKKKPNPAFSKIEQALEKKDWKEADQETKNLILDLAKPSDKNNLKNEDIENISCTDIKHINHLWEKFSNNKFGFRIQQSIWEKSRKDYNTFAKQVGWPNDYDHLKFDSTTIDKPDGHLPAAYTIDLPGEGFPQDKWFSLVKDCQ